MTPEPPVRRWYDIPLLVVGLLIVGFLLMTWYRIDTSVPIADQSTREAYNSALEHEAMDQAAADYGESLSDEQHAKNARNAEIADAVNEAVNERYDR